MENINSHINKAYVITVKALLHTIKNLCIRQPFRRNMTVLVQKIKFKINL